MGEDIEVRTTLHEMTIGQLSLVERIERLIEEGHGEITEEVELMLEEADAQLPELAVKFDSYVHVMDEVEARAEALKGYAGVLEKRIKGMKDRSKTLLKAKDQMKRRLQGSMEVLKLDKLETKRHRFTLAKNGGKPPLEVDLGDLTLDDLDPMYIKQDIDAAAVRHALDGGEELEWARYGERGRNLRIK